jgi:hypothetical protein
MLELDHAASDRAPRPGAALTSVPAGCAPAAVIARVCHRIENPRDRVCRFPENRSQEEKSGIERLSSYRQSSNAAGIEQWRCR